MFGLRSLVLLNMGTCPIVFPSSWTNLKISSTCNTLTQLSNRSVQLNSDPLWSAPWVLGVKTHGEVPPHSMVKGSPDTPWDWNRLEY